MEREVVCLLSFLFGKSKKKQVLVFPKDVYVQKYKGSSTRLMLEGASMQKRRSPQARLAKKPSNQQKENKRQNRKRPTLFLLL